MEIMKSSKLTGGRNTTLKPYKQLLAFLLPLEVMGLYNHVDIDPLGIFPPGTKKKLCSRLPLGLLSSYMLKRADIFIISFPKCGRTWLRLMIGRALSNHFNIKTDNLLNLTESTISYPGFPRMKISHDDDPHLKSADELIESKRMYKDVKVIFLVRDPRDTIVSLYFQKIKRDFNYQGELTEYLKDKIGGIDTLIRFYQIWALNRQVPKDFLCIRYEDLHNNAKAELYKVLNFIGINHIAHNIIEEAIEFSTFDNMRNMEAQNYFTSKAMRFSNKYDNESFKTRRGIVGGFRDYLSPEDVLLLNKRLATGMPNYFGYHFG
jgi:hypothetical protein